MQRKTHIKKRYIKQPNEYSTRYRKLWACAFSMSILQDIATAASAHDGAPPSHAHASDAPRANTRHNTYAVEKYYRELRDAGPSARLRRTQASRTACCSLALGTYFGSALIFFYTLTFSTLFETRLQCSVFPASLHSSVDDTNVRECILPICKNQCAILCDRAKRVS